MPHSRFSDVLEVTIANDMWYSGSSDSDQSDLSLNSDDDADLDLGLDDEELNDELLTIRPSSRLSLVRSRKQSLRKPSTSTENTDATARSYAEALRVTRMSSRLPSLSVGSSGGASTAASLLTEETRKRHREAKKRLELADLTQSLLFQTHALDQIMEDFPLWLHASIIPPRWRIQIMGHLRPIHHHVRLCQERVLGGWKLLFPPFDRANIQEYEKRAKLFEQSVLIFETTIHRYRQRVVDGERESAGFFIQLWYRKTLAKVNLVYFYCLLLTTNPCVIDSEDSTPRLSRLLVIIAV